MDGRMEGWMDGCADRAATRRKRKRGNRPSLLPCCAQSLSSLFEKFPNGACNLPCKGNSIQVCSRNLKITVYMASAATAARVAWAAGLVTVGAISPSLV
ncbi:hypothetical protein VTK56DRAFT_2043 [Thermocarpiscus australiensis]